MRFASREGDPCSLAICDTQAAEADRLAARCEELVGTEGLLPRDILVLTVRRGRALKLAAAISRRIGDERVHCPFEEEEKDNLAIQPDKLTVSTVASAKGYDAPYVMVASLDDFPDDVEGRASLYVACTRAREWLAVSAVGTTGLVREFERALEASNG